MSSPWLPRTPSGVRHGPMPDASTSSSSASWALCPVGCGPRARGPCTIGRPCGRKPEPGPPHHGPGHSIEAGPVEHRSTRRQSGGKQGSRSTASCRLQGRLPRRTSALVVRPLSSVPRDNGAQTKPGGQLTPPSTSLEGGGPSDWSPYHPESRSESPPPALPRGQAEPDTSPPPTWAGSHIPLLASPTDSARPSPADVRPNVGRCAWVGRAARPNPRPATASRLLPLASFQIGRAHV